MLTRTRVATEGRTIKAVLDDLNAALRAEVPEFEGHSFGPLWHQPGYSAGALWPDVRWFACYALRGGSEGYYVHLQAIIPPTGDDATLYGATLVSYEKFWSWDAALAVASACTLLLDQ